jgi:hypothetical protein
LEAKVESEIVVSLEVERLAELLELQLQLARALRVLLEQMERFSRTLEKGEAVALVESASMAPGELPSI